MMQAFTEGIDKIYCDLDGLDDLQSRLCLEAPELFNSAPGGKELPVKTPTDFPWVYTRDPSEARPLGGKTLEEYLDSVSSVEVGVLDDSNSRIKEELEYYITSYTTKGDDYSGLGDFNVWMNRPDGQSWGQIGPNKDAVIDVVNRAIAQGLGTPAPAVDRYGNPYGHDYRQEVTISLPPPPKESTTNNMKTFKTFENKVSRWVAEADSKFDQDVFNILSDMEAEIETGEYPQEEIVDMVSDRLESQRGRETSTDEGSQIERQVEEFYSMLGLDSVPADRRSRDYVADEPPTPDRPTGIPGSPFDDHSRVPGKVEGQPWVHSDDDFIFFLQWLLKQVNDNDEPTFNAKRIVDVVEEPHRYMKEYKQFLDHRQRVDDDPYL